jgi:hypothetical protein
MAAIMQDIIDNAIYDSHQVRREVIAQSASPPSVIRLPNLDKVRIFEHLSNYLFVHDGELIGMTVVTSPYVMNDQSLYA